MEKMQKNKKYMRIALAALFVTCVLLTSSIINQRGTVRALSQQTENHYMAAFSDLCDYVDDIDVLIKKSMLAKSRKQIWSVASQVFMESASAKACLSQLPLSDVNLDNTSKFLVQTGDYMMYIAANTADGDEVTDEEFNNLSALSDYAEKIKSDLEALQDKIYNGEISFLQEGNISENTEVNGLSSQFSNLENEFMEYPSLIYDGPFSEHIEKKTSVFLSEQGKITEKEALSIAAEILGQKRSEGLSFADDGGGAVESYIFTKEEDKRSMQIAITKYGGKVLWMLDSRDVAETKIDIKDARLFANRFLIQCGYTDMKESYYEKNGNVATLNYAYKQENVTVYSDLIKVKVALDNGEILGVEAKGYLMNHSTRELKGDVIGEEEAKKRAGKHLDVSDINMAIIPLESGREVLCYELKGSFENRNFLIYVNAYTGEDEKILMLIESADGILTV